MAGRRVLVTGGCGFIGSHLVAALVARGDRVRVLDDFSSGSRAKLAAVAADVEVFEGDVRDPDAVRRAVAGTEYVLHEAALVSVPRSLEEPLLTHAIDATGALNVLVAAREAGVRRVLYAGSASAYGDDPALPKREDMAPQPLSPYAAAKLAGEHYCAAFAHGYGLETVVLRYFNVYGPRQDPRSPYAGVISRFIAALLRGEPPTIYGDGSQSRDFVYVDDVVAANLLALEAPMADGAPINVASGQRHSLLELVAALNAVLGTAIAPRHEPRRAGDVWHSQASIARAAERLGYRPAVTLRDGLARTVAWYRAQPAAAIR
ncbi:MAG TPA: SDR family oxidoreductase [Chloroflexota bacterium]|nr:SDR family oxidoreductase [Chloroflexota bacterium]